MEFWRMIWRRHVASIPGKFGWWLMSVGLATSRQDREWTPWRRKVYFLGARLANR